jgi:hypothetical protein
MKNVFFFTTSALAFVFVILAIAGFSCSDYSTDTSGKDLYEEESVWQYLKAYSFWQNRVPKNAFVYDSPEAMMASVLDTLRGSTYTLYWNATWHSSLTHSSASASTVGWAPLTDSTVYVQISSFSEKDLSTFDSLKAILPDLRKYSRVIIDLIDNGGGGIAVTDSIINSILPYNTPYIMESYRRYDDHSRTAVTIPWDTIKTKRAQDPYLAKKRYALLINGGSASASEILIAALKDGFSHASNGDTTVIVGETSYGKGIGQVQIDRSAFFAGSHDRDLKITFMRMKGISDRVGDYFRKGIRPDINVAITNANGAIDRTAAIKAALKVLEPSVPATIKIVLGKQIRSVGPANAEAIIIAAPDNIPKY